MTPCLIALKIDTKFEGKLVFTSKNWHEEFGKLSPEHVWKSKYWEFNGVLLSKVENV